MDCHSVISIIHFILLQVLQIPHIEVAVTLINRTYMNIHELDSIGRVCVWWWWGGGGLICDHVYMLKIGY
jgi:hypothetical protein